MATELFLQCYQLILWKQCYSLIHEKELPPQLEIVVKDLWALRLELLKDKFESSADRDAEASVYSSQVEDTGTESGTSLKESRFRKEETKLPTLVESLGLCYLGMVLLRIPISLGDLQR